MIDLFRLSALTRFSSKNKKSLDRRRGRRSVPPSWFGLEELEPRVMLSGDTIVHSFSGDTAANGVGSGVLLVNSKLYGIAENLGANDKGMLYSVNQNGSGFQDLHDFGGTLPDQTADGATPFDNPILVGTKLYGTTTSGGDTGAGVIYSINLDGSGYTIVRAYSFTSDNIPNGLFPWGGLASDGTKIYGTTLSGGTLPGTATPFGVIFSMDPDGGDYTVLHTFAGTPGSDAAGLMSPLVLSGNTLYGVSGTGGAASKGAIFSINTDGMNYQVLHSFDDGGGIDGALAVVGSTIIGTTSIGGASGNGTVYSMNTNGTGFTVQHSFSASVDGGIPLCDLLVSGNKIFGTTTSGGPSSITVSPAGNVFSVNTDGTGYQLVYTFNSDNTPPDGGDPQGELATDGTNIYGTDATGGAGGVNGAQAEGVIFSVPINGGSQQSNVPTLAVTLGSIPITSFQSNPIDFGSASLNQTPLPKKTFTLTNTGNVPLTFNAVQIPLDVYVITPLSKTTLAPGQSEPLTISMKTDTKGTYPSFISISSNDGGLDGNTFTIPITGDVDFATALLPDITGDIEDILVNNHSVTPADTVIPGDTVTAKLRVFDNGAGALNAKGVGIQFYASLDQSLDTTPITGDIPIQLFPSNTLNIAGGGHVDLSFNLQVPQNIVQGNYFILADLDSGHKVPESNDGNNTAASGKTVPVVLEAGQVSGKSNVTLKFVAPNGTPGGVPVTLTLTKGGTATVDIVNNALDIVVTGSNANAALTLSTGKPKSGSAIVTIHSVTINGVAPAAQSFAALASTDSLVHAAAAAAAPLVLKSFTATNGDLIGNFEVDGAIQTIKIGSVTGGKITIDAPPGNLPVAPLVLTIPLEIKNGSIDSAIPIKSLTTIDWIDDAGPADFIKAPSIGTITTTGNKKSGLLGDFQADVAAEDDGGPPVPTTLTTAKIAGSITGAAWNLIGTPTIQTGHNIGNSADPSNAVTINAVAIKSLKVGGDLDNATILLSQPVVIGTPKLVALGTLTVTGTVNASSIVSAGSITTATVGGLIGSTIFAGVDTSINAIGVVPDAGTDFNADAQIGKLTVTGVRNLTVDFEDSIIAASQLGTITVINLPTDGSATGGVVGETLLKSYIRTANKKSAFNLKGPKSGLMLVEQLDDYVVKLVV